MFAAHTPFRSVRFPLAGPSIHLVALQARGGEKRKIVVTDIPHSNEGTMLEQVKPYGTSPAQTVFLRASDNTARKVLALLPRFSRVESFRVYTLYLLLDYLALGLHFSTYACQEPAAWNGSTLASNFSSLVRRRLVAW